jgi:hypothetical protein
MRLAKYSLNTHMAAVGQASALLVAEALAVVEGEQVLLAHLPLSMIHPPTLVDFQHSAQAQQ